MKKGDGKSTAVGNNRMYRQNEWQYVVADLVSFSSQYSSLIVIGFAPFIGSPRFEPVPSRPGKQNKVFAPVDELDSRIIYVY